MASKDSVQYGIGQQAVGRRRVLNQLVNQSTQQFLLGAGLRPGMRVLDLTCGMGFMSSWLALQVGDEGQVVAADSNADHLTIAEQFAKEQGIENIDFVTLDIDAIDLFPQRFDLIYCRFLFIHSRKPEHLLKSIYDHLEDKGIFACESAILGHEFCYPYNQAFDRWRQLNHDVFKSLEKDPQTGKKLSSMMTDIGFSINFAHLYQPVLINTDERRELILNDMLEQAPIFNELGLATQAELDVLELELTELINDPKYFIAYTQSCQIAGVR